MATDADWIFYFQQLDKRMSELSERVIELEADSALSHAYIHALARSIEEPDKLRHLQHVRDAISADVGSYQGDWAKHLRAARERFEVAKTSIRKPRHI